VVLDTNVMLSALFWGGPSSKIVALAEDGVLELCSSVDILQELETVLSREKFVQYATSHPIDLGEAVEKFLLLSTVVTPSRQVAVCRDPKDNQFLECAFEARASYVVTGDHDLQALGAYEGVKVLSPAQFLKAPAVRRMQLHASIKRATACLLRNLRFWSRTG
jgi:putative PIN family toxin of toxin-antitoxin system